MLKIQDTMEVVGAVFDREQYQLLMGCSARRDMSAWNIWRKNNSGQRVLLQTACLQGAWLRGADLRGADLRGANLRGADLSGARLPDLSRRWADLSGADFREADLCGTDLRGANVSGADFRCAYLYYTNFSWTNLRGANLCGADLWSFFYKADLRGVNVHLANRRRAHFTLIGCALGKPGPVALRGYSRAVPAESESQLPLGVPTLQELKLAAG